jgi:hypothetical protein
LRLSPRPTLEDLSFWFKVTTKRVLKLSACQTFIGALSDTSVMRDNDAKTARFKIGDRVQILRPEMTLRFAVVAQVDRTRDEPHYALDFGNGPLVWLADSDLARADEEINGRRKT